MTEVLTALRLGEASARHASSAARCGPSGDQRLLEMGIGAHGKRPKPKSLRRILLRQK